MKKFIVLFCLVISPLATGQITVTDDFEGGNIDVISINNTDNSISVKPALRPNDTKGSYFFFKVKGYSSAQPLKINLYTTESYYAPVLAGAGYDLITWDRVPAVNFSGFKRYTLSPVKDSIYFAVGYPYTYSNMIDHLNSVAGSAYLNISDIAVSEEGRAVKLLKVTDPMVSDSAKKLVWIIARQHAFEVHSNYVIEGLIDELLSESYAASRLRKQSIVYIVPIMDVDNAFNGGTGKDQNPVDFNRDWDSPSYWNAVIAVKNKLEVTVQLNKLEVFIDSHDPFPGDNPEIGKLFVYALHSTGPASYNVDFFRDVFFENGGYTLDRYELYPTIGQTSTRYADSVYSPGISFSIETGWVKRTDGAIWDIAKYLNNGKVFLQTISGYINNIPFEDDIIIDNKDSSQINYQGEWISSSYIGGYYGTDYVHDNNSQKGFKSVTYIPAFSINGYYEVFLRWTSDPGRASNVPVTIIHNDGTAQLHLNQEKLGAGWVSLGIFNFNAGNFSRIIVETTDTDGYVIADAVRLSRRDSPVNVSSEINNNPATFMLHQNYPNPFNPETTIRYSVPEEGNITTIKLYDVLGKEISVLLKEEQPSGSYELKLNLDYLPSGIYFYQLTRGAYSDVKKLVLLK